MRIRPDFYLPDHNLFYEHFGMNDESYIRATNAKIFLYRQNGARIIYTTIQDEPEIEDVLTDKLAAIDLGLSAC